MQRSTGPTLEKTISLPVKRTARLMASVLLDGTQAASSRGGL